MKKTLKQSKLGLNKDAVKTIAEDKLAQITGGTLLTVSGSCTPHTTTLIGGVCY